MLDDVAQVLKTWQVGVIAAIYEITLNELWFIS